MNNSICNKNMDFTSNSFFLIKIALMAVTAFLIIERNSIKEKWKTPLTVSALVTGIAAVHYHYMSNIWLKCNENPISIRYIDWFLTAQKNLVKSSNFL
jgi:NO-binding membrane sensor protein with MHYT domain